MASRSLSLSAFVVALAALLWLSPGAPRAPAAQDDPAALVRAYWAERDNDARAALARRIASHPDYRPSRLRDWLHGGVPFEEMAPGTTTMTVESEPGTSRQVTLILPDGYRRDRAWPLVYALHPSGEPADTWAEQVKRMLGTRAREFVIASPEYRQNYIAAKPPFVAEHAVVLDAVARRVHVDANRVYAFGYSKGGFAAWYVTVFFADRFAGTVALAAGFDVAPGPDGFWTHLAGNVAHVPVLNAWGEKDPLVIRDLAEKPAGTFAESNRWFTQALRGMDLPVTNIEVVGGLHNQLALPGEAVVDILNRCRVVDTAACRPRLPPPAPGLQLLDRGPLVGRGCVGRAVAGAAACRGWRVRRGNAGADARASARASRRNPRRADHPRQQPAHRRRGRLAR